jgi:hypothetical protein
MIDGPTLGAIALVLYIFGQWNNDWGRFMDSWLGNMTDGSVNKSQIHAALSAVRGQTFVAGAIAFQLFAANIQILLTEINLRYRRIKLIRARFRARHPAAFDPPKQAMFGSPVARLATVVRDWLA